MRALKESGVVAATLGVAIAGLASPVVAEDMETTPTEVLARPTANGDGVLSDSEAAALALMAPAEVTAPDLGDVSEADLERLPLALRARIQEPVALVQGQPDTPAEGLRSLAASSTKQVVGQWWHENAFGWHLTDYYIAASFSYDGTKVIEPSDWSWGNGHWGYQFCNEDARGSRWINSKHTQYQTFGRGLFGPPGCDVITLSNGGTLNMDGTGRGWLS